MDGLCFNAGLIAVSHPERPVSGNIAGNLGVRRNAAQASALRRSASTASVISTEKPPERASSLFTGDPRKFAWPIGGNKKNDDVIDDRLVSSEERGDSDEDAVPAGRKENWIMKILRVNSRWTNRRNCNFPDLKKEGSAIEVESDEDDDQIKLDRHSFSKLLRRVTLAEAKIYGQMAYLGRLAYNIPKIKPENLLKYDGLRFVISSMEKKDKITVNEVQESETEPVKVNDNPNGPRISASAAYDIVASAASYLRSHAKGIIPFHSGSSPAKIMNRDMASLVATADSVTAVVAARDDVKQAVADDLKSRRSSPCDWFICDDDQIGTRFFVIQGSESLASWQANLLFEPIHFEGLEFLVHRGIYEAAKGIYEQMLPEVHEHLNLRRDRATFRFTGHSLGGSLALLVSLMLVVRCELPPSLLLPVITFGSPSVMCCGDDLLRRLGLSRNHVQSVTMHRDIVPRAFSCRYPSHVARLLRALNKNFRDHPCLNKQKHLYAPMGEFLILQPDESFSPNHHLLPSGTGLYVLTCSVSGNVAGEDVRAAQTLFLNSPHPLVIMSDRSAYGSAGSIQKHHDLNSYIRSVRTVISHELNRVRKAKRERRRKEWWPLVLRRGSFSMVPSDLPQESRHVDRDSSSLSLFVRLGRRCLAFNKTNLLIVLLFPTRMLVFSPFLGIRIW